MSTCGCWRIMILECFLKNQEMHITAETHLADWAGFDRFVASRHVIPRRWLRKSRRRVQAPKQWSMNLVCLAYVAPHLKGPEL
jgi:hypothetical protein